MIKKLLLYSGTSTLRTSVYSEVLGITNDIPYPTNSKIHEKNLDITKPRYREHILPAAWPSRLYRGSTVLSFEQRLLASSTFLWRL